MRITYWILGSCLKSEYFIFRKSTTQRTFSFAYFYFCILRITFEIVLFQINSRSFLAYALSWLFFRLYFDMFWPRQEINSGGWIDIVNYTGLDWVTLCSVLVTRLDPTHLPSYSSSLLNITPPVELLWSE